MNQVTTENSARTHRIKLILTEWKRQEDGGWVVRVWGNPGLCTQGRDEREARLSIIDVFFATLDSCDDYGEPLQWDSHPKPWEGAELRWVRLEHGERVINQ